MKAVKGNKVYTIGESQQKSYQDMGFDILGDGGDVVAYGRGKTVPYDEYMKLAKELEELKATTVEPKVETEAEPEKKATGKAAKKAGE